MIAKMMMSNRKKKNDQTHIRIRYSPYSVCPDYVFAQETIIFVQHSSKLMSNLKISKNKLVVSKV